MLASKCRGLQAIHLLPLDPDIEKLHHEGVLFLGASHILVQYVQEDQELHMISFGCDIRMILKVEALVLSASSILPDSTRFLWHSTMC